MNVDNIISRATHSTGRTLLILGCLVIIFWLFGQEYGDISFIESAGLKPEMLYLAVPGVLSYLLIAHWTNWRNDYRSFRSASLAWLTDSNSPDDNFKANRIREDYRDLLLRNIYSEFTLAGVYASYEERFLVFGQHLFLPVFIGILALALSGAEAAIELLRIVGWLDQGELLCS